MIGSIFLHLEKAFDVVHHDVLLQKLNVFKCSEQSLKWLTSYLSRRKQFVYINLVVSCGVPKGSVIGPCLFFVHINDFDLCLSHCSFDIFDDDTTLDVYGKSTKELSTAK